MKNLECCDNHLPHYFLYGFLELLGLWYFSDPSCFQPHRHHHMLWQFACIKCRVACMRAYVLSRFNCVRPCDPKDCSPPGSLSMEFSYQEYWSGLPWPPPGNLADLEIKSRSPVLQVDSLVLRPQGKPYGVELFIFKNVLS